jgi:hypothetical protein
MSLGERDRLEELGVDGKIILKLMCQEMGWRRVDWSDLAYDRAVVNTVINLGVT